MVLNKGNAELRQLPVFDSDTAFISYTWRELIDIYTANNGHNPDEKKFRQMIRELYVTSLNETMLEFNNIKAAIMEEVLK